ncbi:2-5-dichloro-2-5-cyclohexadiene-1-4-diol dehydrogenase [Apiospora hydei]|uniref:2-5-dichloro-2-5-cyclohexadiene-1-4-diol dehydrogenase n=1 Tax=Apiospora hydei TaxID=1337664 RepID=A0ABR1WPN9_9PEZI
MASWIAPVPAQRLFGKTVLITGAGGTIGLETAARMLQEGANLSLVDISAEALDRAVAKLSEVLGQGADDDAQSRRILSIRADCTEEAEVQDYTDRTIQKFGRLDCAFLNAGVSYGSTSIFDTQVEDYERLMRVNVRSGNLPRPKTLSPRDARRQPDPGGGSIVLTSSVAGLRGTPGLIAYSAAKFALRGLALTAAAELGPLGIRVNTVHPSGVGDSAMFREAWRDDAGKMEEMRRATPLGRLAGAGDVAGAVMFLASDDAGFITGGLIKIDGGSVTYW